MLHWQYFILDNVKYKSVETFLNFSTMKIIFILAVCLLAGILAVGDGAAQVKRKRSKRDLIYWNRHSNSVLKYTYSRLPKIDTPKIDTFSEISRNFEKLRAGFSKDLG